MKRNDSKYRTRQNEGGGCGRLGPEIVHLAVGFSVSYETGAHLVQHESTVGAFETRGVPLEVRRHTQYELIEDWTAASAARTRPSNS